MKKVIVSFVAIIILSIAILSCGNKEHDHPSSEVYTCPMHLEVVSDKPGSCPQCEMDLVKKETIKMEAQPDSTIKADSSIKCNQE